MGCNCVNDLSLVNASIRPSGESYRDRLLNREWNSNPSELIDKLLEPNHGYLVFQEDTIKFLTEICGLQGSEADNIRRAIGRKQRDRLEAALPSILEGYCSKSDKPREIAENEANAFLKIIEDSANYQFGYNHSTGYSMIGYVCGYLRHYYPCEFITSYLNNSNTDVDINAGTALARQLNIAIENIKFRYSGADYSCDAKNRKIYKGISSIKYMNKKCAEELLSLKDNKYNSFIDLLVDISEKDIDSRQLEILIKLDFFSEFGHPNMLLKQRDIFNKVYGKKVFSKNKLDALGIPEYIIAPISKETKSQYRGFDSVQLMNELLKVAEYPKTSILDHFTYEHDNLGYVQTVVPKLGPDYYYVQKIENNWMTIYQISTGNVIEIKFRKYYWNSNPVFEHNMIKVLDIHKEHKKRPKKDENGNEIRDGKGKLIWMEIEEQEDILGKWSVILED